jgi:hypothetical protein
MASIHPSLDLVFAVFSTLFSVVSLSVSLIGLSFDHLFNLLLYIDYLHICKYQVEPGYFTSLEARTSDQRLDSYISWTSSPAKGLDISYRLRGLHIAINKKGSA